MPSPDTLPIALVGLRGSGKTTVGRLLARELGRKFVDLDEATVRRARKNGLALRGSSAGELLAAHGLQVFRGQERHALFDCLYDAPKIVLATGGGVVEVADNLEMLREMAFCVWLHAPPEVLASRVEADPTPRPRLLPGDALAEARELAALRGPWYRQVAKLDLDCSNMSPELVAVAVATQLRAWPSRS